MSNANPWSVERSESSTIMYRSNTSSLLRCLAEQTPEQLLLPTHLLNLVHLEGVLYVPLTLVLAGEVAAKAALQEDRYDPLVRDAVLDALVRHLVELRVDMVDVGHEIAEPRRVRPEHPSCEVRCSQILRVATPALHLGPEPAKVRRRSGPARGCVIGFDDEAHHLLAGTITDEPFGDHAWKPFNEDTHVQREADPLRAILPVRGVVALDPLIVEVAWRVDLKRELHPALGGIGYAVLDHLGWGDHDHPDHFASEPGRVVDVAPDRCHHLLMGERAILPASYV